MIMPKNDDKKVTKQSSLSGYGTFSPIKKAESIQESTFATEIEKLKKLVEETIAVRQLFNILKNPIKTNKPVDEKQIDDARKQLKSNLIALYQLHDKITKSFMDKINDWKINTGAEHPVLAKTAAVLKKAEKFIQKTKLPANIVKPGNR